MSVVWSFRPVLSLQIVQHVWNKITGDSSSRISPCINECTFLELCCIWSIPYHIANQNWRFTMCTGYLFTILCLLFYEIPQLTVFLKISIIDAWTSSAVKWCQAVDLLHLQVVYSDYLPAASMSSRTLLPPCLTGGQMLALLVPFYHPQSMPSSLRVPVFPAMVLYVCVWQNCDESLWHTVYVLEISDAGVCAVVCVTQV